MRQNGRSARWPADGRAAWAALAATAAVAALAAVAPHLRPVLIVLATWGAVGLVVAGQLLFRPRPATPWRLIAAMLVLWSVGTTLVQFQGRITPAVDVVVGLGQTTAMVVTLVLVRVTERDRTRRLESLLDVLVIATVLALVAAQLVSTIVTANGPTDAALAIPIVDTTICGLLLRVVVAHARPRPAVLLGMAAALATVIYDLLAQLGGHRQPLPGDRAQIVGIVCVLLFGVTALHPTMVLVFGRGAFARRAPSSALLGLLPLVVVPLASWGLARLRHTAGLPTPVLLGGGCALAGLCLVRGAVVLRVSENRADRDPLTGLVNRWGLATAFEKTPPSSGWALLAVDIDEFKQVNDAHGHDVGDALLLGVRDVLLAETAGRALVGRLGGDHFVVLTDTEQATTLGSGLVRALRDPVVVNGLELRTRARIGLASVEESDTLPELLTRADIAMYSAKSTRSDSVASYESRMQSELTRRFTLTGQLRQLFEVRPSGVGHLEVHYQPLVDICSGLPVAGEALVRWRHPQHGLLSPGAFLDLAHLNGLDLELDSAVLRMVLTHLSRWQRLGLRPLPISYNLTRDSILDRTLASRMLTALDHADIPTSLINVEITEWEELPDDEVVAENLDALHTAGIGLHLDDYGAGYTSLDYLRRFPIEMLKLDRSVVTSVTDAQARLVAGIGAMARTLGLDILAEGIETAEQRACLIEQGIRFGQGWLFGAAMPANDFAERVLSAVRDREAPRRRAHPVPDLGYHAEVLTTHH